MAVLGHSMGGAIALGLHARRPRAITHLGLLASARIGRVPLMPLLRMVAVRPIAHVTPYFCGRAIIAAILRFAHAAPRRFTARDVDEYWAPTQYPAELRASFALIRRFDWGVLGTHDLARLHVPCLVMTGGRDRVISPAGASSRVCNIPDVRYRVLEEHGHLFLESSYDITNEEILTLLSRRGPPG
jgi:pimeloyl-ACP methyl ester carboxylesterase